MDGEGTDSEMADIPPRVAALETQVHRLTERVLASEHDAAAARVLAGGADRDATDVRVEMREFRQATTASFNAMREDLVDLRAHVDAGFGAVDRRFEAVDRRFDAVDRRFDAVDRGFIEVRGRLDATAAGQQHIVDLLTTLIDQQDDQTGTP